MQAKLLAAIVVLAASSLLNAACGGASSGSAPAVPAACDPAAERGDAAIRYRLVTAATPPYVGGSTISGYDAHTASRPRTPEPLTGTIDLKPISPLPEGARFAASVVGYELSSPALDLHPIPGLLPARGTIIAADSGDYGVTYEMPLGQYSAGMASAPASVLSDECPPAIAGLFVHGYTTTSRLSIDVVLFAVPD